MKSLATILKVAFAVAALAMSSCVVNDHGAFDNEPQAIGFSAVVGPASESRAIITDLNYPNNLPFAAFASQLGEGKSWDTNKAEAIPYIDGAEVAYDTYLPGKWTTETAYYWPDLGTLTFAAYSPYIESLASKFTYNHTTGNLAITNWDVTAQNDVDLMVADLQTDLTSEIASSGVPVAFRHKLALVTFQAGLIQDYVEGGTTYHLYLQRVELCKIKTKGNYSSLIGGGGQEIGWSGQSEPETVVIYQNTSGNPAGGYDVTTDTSVSVADPILVMPQVHTKADNLTEAYISVTYFDSKTGITETKTKNLGNTISDSHWAMNNHYTYMLLWERGTPKYIEFTTPSVGGWDNGGSYTITID